MAFAPDHEFKGGTHMKPSPEQLTRLKAYYEAKIFSEVEIDAVKHKVLDKQGVFLLLDARPREAFLAGHIVGALSVPLDQAGEAAKVLPAERQYVTYCWSDT
jgi:3-mercaptopyruvate sulfurtransferase SseA